MSEPRPRLRSVLWALIRGDKSAVDRMTQGAVRRAQLVKRASEFEERVMRSPAGAWFPGDDLWM